MSATDTDRSRWALSQNEVIVYSVVMLLAFVAPFSGLILEVGFGGEPINLLPLLWPAAGLGLGAVYLGRRRRRTAADDVSDQFFDR